MARSNYILNVMIFRGKKGHVFQCPNLLCWGIELHEPNAC